MTNGEAMNELAGLILQFGTKCPVVILCVLKHIDNPRRLRACLSLYLLKEDDERRTKYTMKSWITERCDELLYEHALIMREYGPDSQEAKDFRSYHETEGDFRFIASLTRDLQFHINEVFGNDNR